MTKPTTKTFSKFIIEISPTGENTWAAPCGFNSKSLTLTAASSDTNVPDCDDPEAPAWTERGVTALSAQIQGSGVMATESAELWEEWFDSGASMDVRVRIPGVGYRVGAAILTNLGATVALGTEAGKVQRSVTINSDGPWPWVSGDPDS